MTIDEIVATLLANRKLSSREEIELFFNPTSPQDIVSPFDSGPAVALIAKHIELGNKIAIYGDYDVDGICSTAILWETLYAGYKQVFPHIPHRESEGYGLSITGIDHCLEQGAKLIIAVDNGIVAHAQIDYCRSRGCDIIVIDHHESDRELPRANVLLHSVTSCAAGLTWLLCRDYLKFKQQGPNIEHLSFAAMATICDMVPLVGLNRSFAKFGLEQLNKTARPGLLSLFEVARIKVGAISAYHVGFMIGPRLNSMGRLEHAIDSLRLLCTKDITKSGQLAQVLNDTNRQRQVETDLSIKHALEKYSLEQGLGIILAADTSYNSGIIGLIASKMVENCGRPSIAVSLGETTSKGSGRSIPGFDLTDFLRGHQELFINVGGHAMACGFTIKNENLKKLAEVLTQAEFDSEILIRKRRVDAQIEIANVTHELVEALEKFAPFGLGNPTPQFQSTSQVSSTRRMGVGNKHLKFMVDGLEAVWFNAPSEFESQSQLVTIVYSIDRDRWNGQDRLQLIVKEAYV